MTLTPTIPLVACNSERVLSLAGEWVFALDPDNVGDAQRWFLPETETAFSDTIQLPSTTDEQKKGVENRERNRSTPTRAHPYYGPAWYRREVEVPAGWEGKRITLSLERTKTTTLWVDGVQVGGSQ